MGGMTETVSVRDGDTPGDECLFYEYTAEDTYSMRCLYCNGLAADLSTYTV